jgi:hypothetical protein
MQPAVLAAVLSAGDIRTSSSVKVHLDLTAKEIGES